MKTPYDRHYQTPGLFGEAYPELIQFFGNLPSGGKVLDLGCGQGRDAIALARLGFEVTGIDQSAVGIRQMMDQAKGENLVVNGTIGDINAINDLSKYDVVLLDSMFHFTRNYRQKETQLLQNLIGGMRTGALLIVFIQDTGKKVEILLDAIAESGSSSSVIKNLSFSYSFEDPETGQGSKTPYRLVGFEKLG